MQRNRACASSVEETLEAIKSYREAWDTLQWSQVERLDGQRHKLDISGSVIHNTADGGLLNCLQLEHNHRGIQYGKWSLPKANNSFIKAVAVDQVQDLLVLAERPNL